MGRWAMAAAAMAAWATGAAADGLVSADGVFYSATVNGDGTVLRGGGETIYLGRGCDALVEGFGHGAWGWGAAGTVVSVGRYTVLFPRQIPDYSPSRCAV